MPACGSKTDRRDLNKQKLLTEVDEKVAEAALLDDRFVRCSDFHIITDLSPIKICIYSHDDRDLKIKTLTMLQIFSE